MLNVRDTQMLCPVLCCTIAATAMLLSPLAAHASDGISKLLAVTQQKAQTASADAQNAAERQRQLVAQRRAQGVNVKLDEEQYKAMRASAALIKDLEQRLAQIQSQIKAKGCP